MRLHDSAMHLRGAPTEAVARAVYDAVENARVEALGSRGYQGIADNLETALALRLRSDPIVRARTRSEEHTSELQSLMRISYAVFCLKKKKHRKTINTHYRLSDSITTSTPL